MLDDADLLAKMLETGAFYLCGPTWPVPDVYAALVEGQTRAGKTVEQAQAYLETLKEEERYILEVY
ncbi:sulfite reductase [NADPH] flavoprotein component [Rhodosporidiobolus nylandii]